jgi:hypothetical protein
MSNAALSWAFALPIKKSCDKFLAVTLANYADDAGLCYPSQAKLVGDTALDRKTVLAGIKRLSNQGYISDTGSRKGATGQVVVYRLFGPGNGAENGHVEASNGPVIPHPTIPEKGPLDQPAEQQTLPYFPDKSPVFPEEESRISLKQSQIRATEPSEPSVEPSGEPPIARVEDDPKKAELLNEAFAIWNATCTPALPVANKVTDKRRKAFYARFKGDLGSDIANWGRACRMVADSDFLTGRRGGWSGCAFDWLMTPANLTKVMEGNYANRNATKPSRVADSLAGIFGVSVGRPDNSPTFDLYRNEWEHNR